MKKEKDSVLYLKYRPNHLDEIVGNQDIVDVLKSQLSGNQPMPHSILFHGPTGCGKTTLGRIIANELGAKGSDLREIDSADFRGIDTVRDIRKQSAYKPLEGPCRVWIMDEIHMGTKDAQNALLKALEDTPNHIYYILCTTDPQKLLPTIRGRCSQFQVKPLLEREMKILLRRIVTAEGESITKEVYEQIVQDSLGHPRNALQILAQVLAVKEEKRLDVAKKSAETQSKTIELCRALVNRESWKKISNILKGLKDEEPEQIRRAILGYCQAVLLGSELQNDGVAEIMQEMEDNLFSSGFPGLVFRCYGILYGEDN